jgi:hypothetical protein
MCTILSLLLLLLLLLLSSPSLILMLYYYYYYCNNKTMLDLGFSTTVTMESTVFWDVMPFSPVEVHWCFKEISCICLQDQTVRSRWQIAFCWAYSFDLEDSGSILPLKCCEFLPDYMALRSR